MRVLIVQTTRMGDMIQTGPLITQVRLKYPQAHIAVLSRGLARIVAERHPEVNEVILYDENAMFHDMRSRDSNRLLRAYENAQSILELLQSKKFDLAFNMTHSIASAMLLMLAGVKQVVGAHLSEDWRFVLRGPWTSYFFMSVFSREYNDLNLCDITRSFAAGAPPSHALPFRIDEEDREYVQQLLRQHQIPEGAFLVCMQLGASENNKRWAEYRFAELARILRERHGAQILLVGVKEEAVLGQAFEAHAPGLAVHLFGATSVPQLAALLARASVLVTNDTGTMHLAAAVKCPIALVSVGHVHFRETGPYGEGHVALETRRATLGRSDYVPGAAAEREGITAEQVYSAIEVTVALHAGTSCRLEDSTALAQVELYATRFAPDGYLLFYPLLRRPLQERDLVRILYRAMWLHHLESRPSVDAEVETLNFILGCYQWNAKEMSVWTDALNAAFERQRTLAQQGEDATDSLLRVLRRGTDLHLAQEIVSGLMRLDEESRVFSELHPPLKPLVLLARFERDNLEGADPLVLAEATLEIYRALRARSELMLEKIQSLRRLIESGESVLPSAPAPRL